MTVITWTRRAKCKDCEHIRYYYKGKLKRHKCIEKDEPRCLDDMICDDYQGRREYYPKRLEEDKK